MRTMPALTKVIHPVHDLAAAKAVYATLADVDGNPIGLIQLPR